MKERNGRKVHGELPRRTERSERRLRLAALHQLRGEANLATSCFLLQPAATLTQQSGEEWKLPVTSM